MLEIKESKIHGLGVFANQDISAGIKLYDYVGCKCHARLSPSALRIIRDML